jgi:rhodanese-related sulfurtransferase
LSAAQRSGTVPVMRKPTGPVISALASVVIAAGTWAGLAAGVGCSRAGDRDRPLDQAAPSSPDPGQVQIPAVSVDELDHMLAHHDCQAVDANGDITRRRMGVIPGAVLLGDPESPASVGQLPSDKARALVFYCANPACGASHDAARRAITAGYTHVKVLPEGIAGWVKAGKQTSSI